MAATAFDGAGAVDGRAAALTGGLALLVDGEADAERSFVSSARACAVSGGSVCAVAASSRPLDAPSGTVEPRGVWRACGVFAAGATPMLRAGFERAVPPGRGMRGGSPVLSFRPSDPKNTPSRNVKGHKARPTMHARTNTLSRSLAAVVACPRPDLAPGFDGVVGYPRSTWRTRDPFGLQLSYTAHEYVDKVERRQQILSHARDVFAKRGYHAAKIDDIVAAAGIARGTFYLYFEDKRAIFEEIVDNAFGRLGLAVVRVDTEHASRTVADQIEENIQRIVHALLEDPATTKILLSDAVGLDPAFDRKLLFFYENVGKLLEASLADGQERGIVAEGDARVFAIMTLGAVKEIMYHVVMRDLDYPEDRIVAEIFRFLAAGYLRVER